MTVTPPVWTLALWLVAKHGEAAPQIVDAQITDLRRSLADETTIASWLQVDQVVGELMRRQRKPHETLH